MLANYDAGAVADVMGIAFQPSSAKAEAAKFVLHSQDAWVKVVKAVLRQAGQSSGTPALMEKAVEHGLPRFALRHVAEHLAGGNKAKIAALEWAVVPKTTLERRDVQLSPQESERTERVARLFVQARRALGSEDEAREFMTTAHPLLDGRSPMDATKTDLSTRRVEQILNALEYGLAL